MFAVRAQQLLRGKQLSRSVAKTPPRF